MAVLILAEVLAITGCNLTPAEGYFDADQFEYGDCDFDVLPWEPGFFALDRFQDRHGDIKTVTIRLQDTGGGIERVDGFFIQLDGQYMENEYKKNMDIPLGKPDDSGVERARAIMGFYSTCPEAEVTPELIGHIRFSHFHTHKDGQVSGRIDAGVIVDARLCETLPEGDCENEEHQLGNNLRGKFSFLIERGRPYTNFTGPNKE